MITTGTAASCVAPPGSDDLGSDDPGCEAGPVTRGPLLHGDMTRLRPIEARDSERLWEAVQDPEGTRLTGTTAVFTRDQIDEWARTVSDRPGRYDWAICPAAMRQVRPTRHILG